jgi:hypothetical protein
MRRSFVVAAVAAALVLSTPGPGSASEPESPERALAAVQELLEQPADTDGPDDLSVALRDLFVALPRLSADDRRTARAILARPTDGAADPLEDGYTVPARKKCGKHVCVHWVPTTADAPPNRKWVKANLKVMSKVWRTEIGKLGYRKPAGDKRRGGNAKLDIYLKELSARGAYGYCTPERKLRKHKWLAWGYCVLDNDFAESQYGAPPMQSMRVTAAHEFFHAVQFAYDYGEDRWLSEATATWMEERFADDVNDNRQYLPHGQNGQPAQPLDTFDPEGYNQYGNWTFFEYLSSRFGAGVVRQIWTRAGAFPGSSYQYSTAAVKSVLARRGGFTDVFRRYAAANVLPGTSYAEGKTWPVAPPTASWTLAKDARRQSAGMRISHMASRNVVVRPGDGIGGKRWRLRIAVDGPARATAPAAYLVVKRKKGVHRTPIGLDKKGKGATTVGFNGKQVRWVKVVLVNASTRFSCWHQTTLSCQGRAKDNRQRFVLNARAVHRHM